MSGSDLPLYSYARSRELDQKTIKSGFSELQLMGQAALSSLYQLRKDGLMRHLGEGGCLKFLCGSGANGGDAYALIYMILSSGPERELILRSLKEKESPQIRVFISDVTKNTTAMHYTRLVQSYGISLQTFADFSPEELNSRDWIIEGLFGIGQNRAIEGACAEVLAAIGMARSKPSRPRLISLDVPAGLRENARTEFGEPGLFFDENLCLQGLLAPRPDSIHCYGVEKTALRLHGSLARSGCITILPMGFDHSGPENSLPASPTRIDLHAPVSLFRRENTKHKYQSGHGLLCGGSRAMVGALHLAIRGFFAGGGGILHAYSPDEKARDHLLGEEPQTIFCSAVKEFPVRNFPRALAIGPGLNEKDAAAMRPEFLDWLQAWMERLGPGPEKLPWIILDAGACNWICETNYPEAMRSRTILTPHSGEWKKLGGPNLGCTDDLDQVIAWSRSNCRCHVLIKDEVSCIIAPPEDSVPIRIYADPCAELSVAGSGDVLTGLLLAAFAARRMDCVSPAHKIAMAMELQSRAARSVANPDASMLCDLIRAKLHGLNGLNGLNE